MDHLERESQTERNYFAFRAMLQDLVTEREGQFALLRDRKIVDFFDDENTAVDTGRRRFPDGLFSVQEVRTEPQFVSAAYL